MRKLLLIICFFYFSLPALAESKIVIFQNMINARCVNDKKMNILLLKKSLIELLHGNGCEAKFTSILIEQCGELSCDKLVDIYEQLDKVRAGAVVGD